MKQALKAKSIGDKLFQLERIHSKLVHFSKIKNAIDEKNEKNELLISNGIIALKQTISCFAGNVYDKTFNNYINNINSILLALEKKETNSVFTGMCNLNGSFIKFRKKHKKRIESGCELDFQNICIPLYIINYKFVKKRDLE